MEIQTAGRERLVRGRASGWVHRRTAVRGRKRRLLALSSIVAEASFVLCSFLVLPGCLTFLCLWISSPHPLCVPLFSYFYDLPSFPFIYFFLSSVARNAHTMLKRRRGTKFLNYKYENICYKIALLQRIKCYANNI